MSSGFIDTNVFMHALTRDEHSSECRAFLECLRQGEVKVRLEPYVVHELTYALPRLEKRWTKESLSELLLMIIGLPGVECDRGLLETALSRWISSQRISFVDALLWAAALNTASPVYTINNRDFHDAGVETPRPLPSCQRIESAPE